MNKLVAGRKLEWPDIIERHYAEIYKFCCRLLGSPLDAEDITQEVFIKAYKGQGNFARESDFRGWLFKIARNTCIDHNRWWKRKLKERSISATEHDLPAREGEETPVTFISNPIFRLPKRQQEVFILRHWHEFTTEETARILNISGGSVKSHLSRAVNHLKKELLNEKN